MNRRNFLISASVSIAALTSRSSFAQVPADDQLQVLGALPPLPSDLKDKAASPPEPYTETALVGTAPPSKVEINTAYQILRNSPYDTTPITVAQYFLSVGAGAYGEALRPYAREWPIRANPMIFHFFSSTQTKPEGDTTAWCAAFVNWCLLRARAKKETQIGKAPGFFSQSGDPFDVADLKAHSTNSASSGSFRCWTKSAEPKVGDIVVFANKGTESLTPVCRGQGHVAFYLGTPASQRVRVLGGNQSLPGSNGAVTVAEASMAPGTRFLKIVSPK